MDYEKIIVELLSRIQTLEEQVAFLMTDKENQQKKETTKMTTNDIREYIKVLKNNAKNSLLTLKIPMNSAQNFLYRLYQKKIKPSVLICGAAPYGLTIII